MQVSLEARMHCADLNMVTTADSDLFLPYVSCVKSVLWRLRMSGSFGVLILDRSRGCHHIWLEENDALARPSSLA